MTNERSRGPVLTTLAVLMGLLALSNFSKPLGQAMQPESDAGFVFLGHRLHGAANAVMGPLFGVLLAAYVVVNLVLFVMSAPPAQNQSLAFMAAYTAVAIGVSAGGAWYLYRNRHRLQ